MKFIAFSDQHLEAKLYNIPELEEDNRELFTMVLRKAEELDVDYLVSVGDLFDNNKPSSDTIRFVSEELSRLSADVTPLAIAGDHSKPINGATWEHVVGFHNVNNFDPFVGVDYSDNPQDVIALLNHELNKRAKNTVRWIFMHQQVPELWPFCEDKKKISIKDLDLSNQCESLEGILLGDIHIPREMQYFDVNCGKELFVGYCGSLGVTAADETKKHGLYYYDGEKLSRIPYKLSRKYVTLDIHSDIIDDNGGYYLAWKEKYLALKEEKKRPVFTVKLHNGISPKDLGNKLDFLYDVGFVRMSKVRKDSEGNEEMVNIRSELKTSDRIDSVLKSLAEGNERVYNLAHELLTAADHKSVLDSFKSSVYV